MKKYLSLAFALCVMFAITSFSVIKPKADSFQTTHQAIGFDANGSAAGILKYNANNNGVSAVIELSNSYGDYALSQFADQSGTKHSGWTAAQILGLSQAEINKVEYINVWSGVKISDARNLFSGFTNVKQITLQNDFASNANVGYMFSQVGNNVTNGVDLNQYCFTTYVSPTMFQGANIKRVYVRTTKTPSYVTMPTSPNSYWVDSNDKGSSTSLINGNISAIWEKTATNTSYYYVPYASTTVKYYLSNAMGGGLAGTHVFNNHYKFTNDDLLSVGKGKLSSSITSHYSNFKLYTSGSSCYPSTEYTGGISIGASEGTITVYIDGTPNTYNINYTYDSHSSATDWQRAMTYHTYGKETMIGWPNVDQGYEGNWILNGHQISGCTLPATTDTTCNLRFATMPCNYSISYNLNGGSIDGVSTSDYEYGSSFTLPTCQKTYYTFKGWKDSSNNIITSITPTTYGDLKLTAVFEPMIFNIDYELNGGTIKNKPTSYTIEECPVTVPNPTKLGYNFKQWKVTSRYIGDEILFEPTNSDPKYIIGNPNYRDLKFTAIWEPKNYNITYNTNGGDEVSGDATYTIEKEVTLPTPTKRGYTFVKWNATNDEDGAVNTYSNIPVGTHGNITLTAEWKVNTYKITYKDIDASSNPNPSSYTYGEAVTLQNVEKRGYTFNGWSNNGTKITEISADATGDYELTALFTPNEYNIVYKNIPSGVNNTNPAKYTYNEKLTLKPLEYVGHTFTGWKDSKNQNITEITPGTIDDIELTPSFTTNTYKITYKNIPSGVTNSNPATYTYGTTTKLTNLEQKGYTFKGWKDSKGNKLSELSSQTLGDIELQPEFEANTYKITYKDVPSGVSNSNPATYTYGTAVTLKDISQSGYKFDGWYDSKGNKVSKISAQSVGDVTITAKFTKEAAKTDTKDTKTDAKANNTTTNNKTDTTNTKQSTTTNNSKSTTTTNNNKVTTNTKYKITYTNLPKDVKNPNPTTYTYGTGLKLKSASSSTYTFKYWVVKSTGKKITAISKTAKGNVTLKGVWGKSATTLPKVTGKKAVKKNKYILLSYNKAANVSGYQVQYTMDNKTKSILTSKTTLKINKNAKNVKIRTVKKSNGKYTYGPWS